MKEDILTENTEVPTESNELEADAIRSLDDTKKEIFKILADKEIDQQLKDVMLNHLIGIDRGLIERINLNPKTTFEIKTYNEVVEVSHVLRKIRKELKRLLPEHGDNTD
ncbi:hypothetical protein [Cohnella boryungensis]|uniref:Uncharacterized protein n=1 Tax=Cohnella boryungensis TaxID=768479 RepID=A0ABV8SHA7_9BACL